MRELRCLSLHVLDAHRLPYKLVPQPYCTLQLNNQVRIARTRVKSGPDPVWDEEFIIEYVIIQPFYCENILFTKTLTTFLNFYLQIHL